MDSLTQENCPAVYLNVLEKCLEYGFYESAGYYSFLNAFENYRAFEIIMKHNPTLLKEKLGASGLRSLIQNDKYEFAEMTIFLGVDPREQYDDLNALDYAIYIVPLKSMKLTAMKLKRSVSLSLISL